ncbi:MAG: hypothetical protein AB1411_15320 [Nitrospirota bacterium]
MMGLEGRQRLRQMEAAGVKTGIRTALVGLVLLGAGCTVFVPKETLYLESAQDEATKEDVEKRLGSPAMIGTGPDGERVWVYQVRYQQPGNYLASPGMWCDEYVLTFDDKAILRRWTQSPIFTAASSSRTIVCRAGRTGSRENGRRHTGGVP